MTAPRRVALIGTGHFAEAFHLPALLAHPGFEVTGLWGRTPSSVERIAAEHGVAAFENLDDAIASADCIDIVVAPDAQAAIAVRAAEAGRDLLLEKPLARDRADAIAVARAVETRGVRSQTNLARLFMPSVVGFVADRPASATALDIRLRGDALVSFGPFSRSPWRAEWHGALWDLAPHALSVAELAFGPIGDIRAELCEGEVVLSTRHDSGGRSRSTLSLTARQAEEGYRWARPLGADSSEPSPCLMPSEAEFYSSILTALDAFLHEGDDPVSRLTGDIRFAVRIVELIGAAADQLRDDTTTSEGTPT